MKERILLWLCDYSYKVISYIFWFYFLFIIALNFFDKELNKIVAYLFWLILGLYLGYTIALKVIKYMQKQRGS